MAHVAGVTKGVTDRLVAMLQPVRDALFQDAGDGGHVSVAEATTDAIAAQRQRQVGFGLPPFAQVDDFAQIMIAVGELPLVDDQTSVSLTALYRVQDLVEHDDAMIERAFSQEQIERQERGGHLAGDQHGFPLEIVYGHWLAGHHQRTIPVTHARTAGRQGVVLRDVGIGVNADRRDVQFRAEGAIVQGLYVLQDMLERPLSGVDAFVRQGVEHERVVRVGAVA